jgi:hypothetical protein
VNDYNDSRLAESLGGCQGPYGPAVSAGHPLDLYRGAMQVENLGRGFDGAGVGRFRKARRFFVQCRDGILVAQKRGYMARTFVLTESDYAIGMGLDYGAAVDKFNHKLRYDYGSDVGLVWVEHLQGAMVRHNRHIVEWGREKLDMDDLNSYWLKVYGSLVSWRKAHQGGMVVTSAESAAKYLSEYFAGEGFVRAHFSSNWVFPRWFAYCKWCRKVYGEFPSIPELALLAGLSAVDRLSVARYREWYQSCEGKLKSVLADRLMGHSAVEAQWLLEYNKRHHVTRRLVNAIS